MGGTKLEKKDKKFMIIAISIGFVARFFIDSGMNIAILVFFMYISHKYIATTENIKEYSNYNFINKDKYNKGRKRFVLLLDVYVIIRIISMLVKPQSSYVFNEMILIIIAYVPYENYLDKKYISNTNIEEKEKIVFVKNKLLVSIILFIFVGFSYFTFNTLNELSSNDYVKYGRYEYNLSNINDKRKIEIELGSRYMMGEENEKNSAYFDNYLKQSKSLMRDKIFRCYMFISMLFMFVLCLVEIYPKNNVISIASNLFLVVSLVLSIFAFNFESYDKESSLSSYFHNYISK